MFYKTQREIYMTLFYEKQEYLATSEVKYDGDKIDRIANMFAVKNTQKVWREQYE